MIRQGLFASLILCVSLNAFAASGASVSTDPVSPKSAVSLRGKSIQLDYALTEPGAMSVEIVSMNGKTLGKWNWEDSTSGSYTRELDLNRATENRAVFVLVSGPNIYSIQGLFTGSKSNTVSVAQSEGVQAFSPNQKISDGLDK